MANEISYHGSLAYEKGDSDSFDFGEAVATMTGTKGHRSRQTVGTTEEAIGLGEVPAGSAWFICKNMDATNKVLIAPAAGAAYLIEVFPGQTCGPIRFLSTVTAPVAKSSASTVDFIYLVVQA